MLRPLVVGGAPLFLALCCAADFAQSAAPAGPAANPLLGKWRFTHQANNCAETYEFRADGTFQIVSDKEVSDGVYRISLRPDENGFFTFVVGTDTDAGKTAFSLLFLTAFADRFAYWKPVETGDSDTEKVRRLVPSATIFDPLQVDNNTRAPFPANRIPSARLHPVAQKLMALYPQTNVTGEPTRNYQATLSNPQDRDQLHVRGDWQLSAKDAFMGRYSFTEREDLAASILYSGQTTGNKHRGAVFGYTRIVSPSLLNEVRLGYTRYNFTLSPDGLGTDFATQLGLPSFALTKDLQRFPTVSISNIAGFGGNDAIPLVRTENVWQVIDQVTWIRGKHGVKLGGDWRKYGNENNQPQSSAGFYAFNGAFTGQRGTQYQNGLADLLLGLPQQQRILNPTGFDAGRLRNQKLSLYAQDDWNIGARLTLNLGLRWERDGDWTDAKNRWAFFDYASGRVTYAKDAPLAVALPYPNARFDSNVMRQAISTNFAPRAGFAFRPFGGTRQVVRGAYGVFWAQPIANVQLQLTLNPPFLLRTDITSGTTAPEMTFGVFPGISPDRLVPTIPAPLSLEPTGYLNGYSQQWNFGVDQAMGRDFVARAAYVGSKGTHLERRWEGNPALPPRAGAIQARRLYPLIGAVVQQSSNANASYHSLQLSLDRRFANGWQFSANYTWSKSLDDTSSWTGLTGQESAFAQDPSRLFLDKGLSGFNVAHRFTFNSHYQLPFRFRHSLVNGVLGGWQLSAVVTAQTGFPLTMNTAGDVANASTRIVRANVVGDWRRSGAERSIEEWFTRAAFALPPAFTFGTSARNIVTSPGALGNDLNIMKPFQVREGHTLQFRAEFYSILNHPNFGLPGQTFANPAFARIRSAGGARSIQLALKYVF